MAKPDSDRGRAFTHDPAEGPPVRGYLHEPAQPHGQGVVLTHGAGGNCDMPLLAALARLFSAAGVHALRCNLPFRQVRLKGPPRPATSARDREGLRSAAASLRERVGGPVFVGGQSYGGRQATMLCAEAPDAASGLVLLSYPLHAPQTPEKKRTEHFPRLNVPALFVHGTRDPFGTPDEMKAALGLIPTPTSLLLVEGAGHGLIPARASGMGLDDVAHLVLEGFRELFG